MRIWVILITSPDQINPEWLTQRLRDGGFLPYFRVRDIRLLQSRESESATLHTLRIRFSDIRATRTLPDTLVLKVSHIGHPLADKEVTFYGSLLPNLREAYADLGLSICDCYDAVYDIDADRSHVLLAGLPDTFKPKAEAIPPGRHQFGQLADSLARFHARFWEDMRLGSTIGIALSESKMEVCLARQLEGFERFLADRMIKLNSNHNTVLNMVMGKIPVDYRERLLSGQNLTIIHNRLEAANLLYSHDNCRILDWKHWRLGFAAVDLANMIAFHWLPAKRRFEEPRFLRRYWGELRRCGVGDYSYDLLQRDYRIAVGLRLGELVGSWRIEDWRDGKWRHGDALLNGLRAFEELNVHEFFSA